ncbi:hypothetical protein HMPREF1212_05286 [Parabacteroides sp. HGS0025]|jgi:hypothetical protein|uniref:hypothetical protein n=1 Tax=Parabacteroides TaxID=375288 RepID=UPI0006175178|nr:MULTISPECIES: hypothetical protein [Parabacteroides]KKB45118.1 hypothetical protein HMPREF1212_05286 [Parabacteroides sp. HGS0025]DAP41668.1 MAG TPA: hypothetical protein [Caudoviricetes sp.]DAX75806.1 MAG TPA: hypothetical protein [Caudoviricetes sp.]DAZ04518.1 MAG TPA: hypothetical protein [Caudoviricetes sp.]
MNIIGSKIVGYRYGEAPECGQSFNTQTRQYECGVSMAQVGYMEEVGSFAVSGAYGRKKYYYEGTIVGFGGDDEVCLGDVRKISYNEYRSLKSTYKEVSNALVNEKCDSLLSLLRRGWTVYPNTVEGIEEMRNQMLKK